MVSVPFLRAQGATEYLVLLAVVLIIALVSIALLGFFPGTATDTKITQSNSYWQGARPFAIIENQQAGTSMTLVMRNNDASRSLIINRVNVGAGTTGALGAAGTFGPGETKSVTVNGLPACTPGAVYEYNVSITYNSSNRVVSAQYGAKNLAGKCIAGPAAPPVCGGSTFGTCSGGDTCCDDCAGGFSCQPGACLACS